METIKILIADDHPLICIALKQILADDPKLQIVAEARDGVEAIRKAVELVPDVAIIDISMPKINGLEVTRRIKAECPRTLVLVLTVHDDIEHICM